jgi:carboxyl-terminal processing protease
VDQRLTVVTPIEGSPAHKAGVRPGDVIETIDGRAARGIELKEAVQRILGKPGTEVKLKVLHHDGIVEELTITRAQLQLRTLQGFRRGPDDRWVFTLDPEHKIAYVQLTQFSPTTAKELREALTALQKEGLKGLILDLRFCPGGLLDQALQVAKLFLREGLILTTRGPNKQERSFRADGKEAIADVPLVILLNEQTASAAEIVAGALSDHNRAVLVGSRSFGKGSVQSIVKLDEGGALKLTTAYHYLPSGRNIQKRPGEKVWGVDPTDGYYVPLTQSQLEALKKDAERRALIGLPKDEQLKYPARLTPRLIEEQHADPQLAAALRTMIARVTSGDYVKVGQAIDVLQDHVRQLEEMRQRREVLLKNLNQLDEEISNLQKGVDKKSREPR